MKYTLAIFMLLNVFGVHAQVSSDSSVGPDLSTNAGKFADSSDRLIQREYIYCGHILDCTVEVVHYTDLLNGTRVSCLRFGDNQNRVTLLDSDEVQTLTAAMNMINEKTLALKPVNYTEVVFISRSGFEAGCDWSKGKWEIYLQLRRHDSGSIRIMKKSDFDVFLQILANVKNKL